VLRVAFVLRSTEIQPVFFRFVLPLVCLTGPPARCLRQCVGWALFFFGTLAHLHAASAVWRWAFFFGRIPCPLDPWLLLSLVVDALARSRAASMVVRWAGLFPLSRKPTLSERQSALWIPLLWPARTLPHGSVLGGPFSFEWKAYPLDPWWLLRRL